MPRLRELTDMPDASTQEMFNVMDYLYWANMSGLDLKFELTDSDLNWINASVDSYVWRDHFAQRELWTLLSFEWLNQLDEFSNVIGKGANFEDQPYFMEYFDGTVFPKFIFYSAHSESVYPFLQSLMYPLEMQDSPPATAAFVEFYTKDAADFVRVYYNMAEANQGEYTLYDAMPLSEFQSMVQEQILKAESDFPAGTNLFDWCDMEY